MIKPMHTDRLQHVLSLHFPGATLQDCVFHTSGWESDIYHITLRYPEGETKQAVLRLYPGEGAAQKVAREAEGISRLHRAGYPVPAVWLYEPAPAALGQPFVVMEKLEGLPLWKVLANSSPEQAGALLDRFSALFARLHRLSWQPFRPAAGEAARNPAFFLYEWLAAERRRCQKFGAPGFLPVLDWLEKHLPGVDARPSVVHLDFHANNVLIGQDGALAVIDWTQVGVFDLRADLSWTLLIMGDFGSPAWAERILQGYQQAAGSSVEHLDYFQVISHLKQLTTAVIGLRYGMPALGLNPKKGISLVDEAPFMRRYSDQLWHTTGLRIKEVDLVIAQAGG